MTQATLHTTMGDIVVELFDDYAPKTVANFVGLAGGTREYRDPKDGQTKQGPYYDGTVFHRVIDGFMIQGGDPTGTGRGGPGYTFADEFYPDLVFNRPYLLAMANAGAGTNGSQFFITLGPQPHLNRRHSIFGEVTDPASQQVVDAIGSTPTGRADRPLEDVVITSVDIA
ncbi:MAG: peptidylprolyl isomerase [Propionibacterium sp.]|nr:peptidylprolyl isomerase [Propionibacterium sp.]